VHQITKFNETQFFMIAKDQSSESINMAHNHCK